MMCHQPKQPYVPNLNGVFESTETEATLTEAEKADSALPPSVISALKRRSSSSEASVDQGTSHWMKERGGTRKTDEVFTICGGHRRQSSQPDHK